MGINEYPGLQLSPRQSDAFLNCNARINLLSGSVRSGKTFVSYFIYLNELLNGPRLPNGNLAPSIIVGKTERTVLRNIIDPMKNLFGDDHVKYIQGNGILTLFGNRIYIIGANDDRAEVKIRGMTVGIVLGDEVTTWPENFFIQLLARMSLKGSKLVATTNPDSPFHWLKLGFIDKRKGLKLPEKVRPINLKLWNFQITDNFALTQEYIDDLKSEYSGVWYKRFIEGLWVMSQGVIYDMFDEQIHIYPNDKIPEINLNQQIKEFQITDYWISSDYGTGNPTVFLLTGRDSQDRHYVLREWRYDSSGMALQKTDVEYSEELQNFLLQAMSDGIIETRNPLSTKIFVDPNAASFIQQLYRDKFRFVFKANNEVTDGIRTVASNLSSRCLFIHKSCEDLIQEFANYVWDEKAQAYGKDSPIKKNDHSVDALRYGEHSHRKPRKGSNKLVGRTKQ